MKSVLFKTEVYPAFTLSLF